MSPLILPLLVAVALLFDFLNGMHDAANSIATIVSTRVLKPIHAVFWAAFFNFIAFLVFGLHVAHTVGSGIISVNIVTDRVIFGALGGAILWKIVTWLGGLPSSSSHALVGGLVGAGLAKVGTIALDGTKIKANASRHKAMSYDRMKTEETRLKEEIAKLLADAQATDDAEDSQHGLDRHGDELPEELARRESRLVKIQQAKKLLEDRAKLEAHEEAARCEADGKTPPKTPPDDAVPDPKDQINFTDPESRIMKVSNKGWDQCGNAQIVTNEHQIILAADVTNHTNDVRQVVPMVDQTQANLDKVGVKDTIKTMLGDAGYYSEMNALRLEQRGIDPCLATERLKHNEKVSSAPRGRIPAGLSAKQRMARKLRTKKGREMYAKRKGMIEPIFGQLKQVLGFRQFSMRGLASMRGEWRLLATVHNLLKLWRYDQKVAMGL